MYIILNLKNKSLIYFAMYKYSKHIGKNFYSYYTLIKVNNKIDNHKKFLIFSLTNRVGHDTYLFENKNKNSFMIEKRLLYIKNESYCIIGDSHLQNILSS